MFEKYMNENIKCVHVYAYSSGKDKMCTWVFEETWGMMKICFIDAKKIKKFQKLLYANNVDMFKNIYESNKFFVYQPDNEPNLSSSFL